jgi:NAD(P)-dependent dehydrogenase (short-subunit alcohol dehydrogenase family)
MTGYAAAKHACDGWLSSLRVETKVWGVEVAAVCPCWHKIEVEYFDHDVFAALPRELQVRCSGLFVCVYICECRK